MSDLWFIGDNFVNTYYHAFQDTQSEAKKSNAPQPFIYDNFNVRCFTTRPLSLTKSTPARLVNVLIKALNEAHKLPRFIIIIPDWDILKFIDHYTFGIEAITEKILAWMMDNIHCVVADKKEQI